jgi:hypothetical protein
MYDMYPDYSERTTTSGEPFSERGRSGLGHPESYPIFVPDHEGHPNYPQGYRYLAEQTGAMQHVEVQQVEEQ